MRKLRTCEYEGNRRWSFYCPACGHSHAFDNHWEFDGNMECPTVTPSLITRGYNENGTISICHVFITKGQIHYLNDCTHEYAGKIIDMENADFETKFWEGE